jgi:hypothetical protein
MCCSTLLGFVVGILLFKAFRRFRHFRHGACGYGGCSGHRRWDGDGEDAWQRRGHWRWGGYGAGPAGGGGGEGAKATGRPLEAFVGGLELSERQHAEAAPVFSFLRERLGSSGQRIEAALSVLAAERFDPTPLLALTGELPQGLQRELVDGLEHVHTILISEQREHLRRELEKK